MTDKTFKEYYELERLKYCMGVVADWLNEHREYEIVEGEDRGVRVFAIQTKHSPTLAEIKKIFPFCCYEPQAEKMTNQEWLSEQVKKLPPEEVYDLMYNIVINIGSRYNTSRGGVADWLTQQNMNETKE